MTIAVKAEGVLLCGRVFSREELDEIVETVHLFPKLSRTELGYTICENLSWKTPAGKLKVSSCIQLLERLESEGIIKLPEKRICKRKVQKKISLTSRTEAGTQIQGSVRDIGPVWLERVLERRDRELWNEYVERYHILGYKCPFGAHQRYFIRASVGIVGCLLFSAAAWALAQRDEWIGWTKEDRSRYLNGILNNSRFLIFPWVKVKNLASKALSLACRQIRDDWQDRYGYKPVLLETFVDEELYSGTCYQAANWIYLGKTAGRGGMDRYRRYPVSPKLIYVYPLVRDFRAYLRGERPEWEVGRYE